MKQKQFFKKMSEFKVLPSCLKCEFVILSKIDREGTCNLLHTKPLHSEFIQQASESILTFSEDRKNVLFKYVITRESEFAKLGSAKVVVNTRNESICIQFAKESG